MQHYAGELNADLEEVSAATPDGAVLRAWTLRPLQGTEMQSFCFTDLATTASA
jgi:hypothetical protein